RSVALLVVLALLAGCASRRLVRHGQVNEDALETVRRGLVALRGLAFKTPVPVLALSRDGLGAVVKEEIEQGYSPGDIEHAEAVYQRLGLLPPRPEPLLDGHGDRELARHALLEGDATLAGFAYVLGQQLDRRMIGVVEQQLHGIPGELAKKYPDLPELLRASVAFQYDDGTTFVGQALAAGGRAAIACARSSAAPTSCWCG